MIFLGEFFSSKVNKIARLNLLLYEPVVKDFLNKNCEYSGEDCYYTHTVESGLEPSHSNKEQEPGLAQPQSQGFWDPPSNLAPPSKGPEVSQGPTQSQWIKMKNMRMHLNQMMTRFH